MFSSIASLQYFFLDTLYETLLLSDVDREYELRVCTSIFAYFQLKSNDYAETAVTLRDLVGVLRLSLPPSKFDKKLIL